MNIETIIDRGKTIKNTEMETSISILKKSPNHHLVITVLKTQIDHTKLTEVTTQNTNENLKSLE